MSNIAFLLIAGSLMGGGLLLAQQEGRYSLPDTAGYKKPQQQEPDDAQKAFDVLKKSFPTIMSDWSEAHPFIEGKTILIRRVSSDEAKITIKLRTTVYKEEFENTKGIVSLNLRFYDGVWTVTRWEFALDSTSVDEKGFRFKLMELISTIDGANKE